MDLSTWEWAVLLGVLPVLYALDLFVLPRQGPVRLRTALAWAVVWFAVGLGVTLVVQANAGSPYGAKYATGFLIEKGLSVELALVLVAIVADFDPPEAVRKRAVLIGLILALVIRLPFIALGTALAGSERLAVNVGVASLFFLGAFVLARPHRLHDPFERPALRLAQRVYPFTHEYRGDAFAVRESGRRVFTKAAALLVVLATADLYFDAILPVAFAFTKPAGLVLLSSGFAFVGIRSVYLVMDSVAFDLERLRRGLAAVLVLLGLDLVLELGFDLPTWTQSVAALIVVVFPFAVAIVRRPATPRLP